MPPTTVDVDEAALAASRAPLLEQAAHTLVATRNWTTSSASCRRAVSAGRRTVRWVLSHVYHLVELRRIFCGLRGEAG